MWIYTSTPIRLRGMLKYVVKQRDFTFLPSSYFSSALIRILVRSECERLKLPEDLGIFVSQDCCRLSQVILSISGQ
jgi:hypothetical protein